MSKRTLLPLLFGLSISWLLLNSNTYASLHKSLWHQWETNNPVSQNIISHQEWQDFLNRRVITNEEGINLVDYAHLNSEDLTLLKNYLIRMSQVDIKQYNRNEQLAFWLNIYNAIIVQTVAHYYPVNSIKDINISLGLFSSGPWTASLITIDNIHLSLDEINNRIIRPIWNDPRTHYALSNSAIGSANLCKFVFQGNILSKQLNAVAAEYINSLRGAQVIEGKLIVSKIYDWYKEDFGRNEKDLINHLLSYAKEPLRSQLQHINTINGYAYNWHLNCTDTT